MTLLTVRLPIGTPRFNLAAIELRQDALQAFKDFEVNLNDKGRRRRWEGLLLDDSDVAYDYWTATTPGTVLWLWANMPDTAEVVENI